MNKSSEQAIENYLDTLSAQLGALPLEVQRETRDELRQHLQFLVARQDDPQGRTASALRHFGDPAEIGRRLALEWEEGEWSLSALPLLERINKYRDAHGVEMASVPANVPLKVLSVFQALALLPLLLLSPGILGKTAIIHASPSLVGAAIGGVSGLYFVLGVITCLLEWKRMAATSSAQNRWSVVSSISARVVMAFLIPGILLLPAQGPLLIGVLLMMCVILWVANRYQPSPRARIAQQGGMAVGAMMGLIGGLAIAGNAWLAIHYGWPAWLWLLTGPINYGIASWLRKRPQRS